jgi:Tfp pilus assembly protein PilF
MIIDDLNAILVSANGREINQLQNIFEAVVNVETAAGGKIIGISSRYLPRAWLAKASVRHTQVRPLQDKFVTRLIEYDLRTTRRVDQETFTPPSHEILSLVAGNPLVAKLLVKTDEGVLDRKLSGGSRPIGVSAVRSIAHALLSDMQISKQDEETLKIAAVFRLPIRVAVTQRIRRLRGPGTDMTRLAERGVLSFDGENIEMHEVVRRFFLEKIGPAEIVTKNRLAVEYYQILYNDMRAANEMQPAVAAELTYHMGLSGTALDIKKIGSLVEELKTAARQLYKIYRSYDQALNIYLTLRGVRPDDLDILSYIGRCFGRKQQWDDCAEAFQDAVRMAQVTGRSEAWIYRDWGHIYARYKRYNEARDVLQKAEARDPEDPSIVSASAFIKWQEGEYDEAEALFEKALGFNNNHTYTLRYYAKMLRELGRSEPASKLELRLSELEEGTSEALFVDDDFDDDEEL